MLTRVKTMKERRNVENKNFTATEAWVLGCYVVGHTVIVTKASDLVAKGTMKLINKNEAFKLYRLTKSALNHGEFNEKNYEKFQKILQDERCYIENHPEQFIQTRLKLKNLLQYIENKLDPTFASRKVDLDMVQAAKEYGKYRYSIMNGKVIDTKDVIDVYSWVVKEECDGVDAEEVDKSDVTAEELRDNLKKLGASEEVIGTIFKSLDDCFGTVKK